MTKEISKDQASLVKTSAAASVELSESDLNQVAGGQKNKTSGQKTETQEYLKVEMKDLLISS
jgi:hypothetical protein